MNILMLNYEFPPIGGGAANANYYLFQEFANWDDLEIDLITSSPQGYLKKDFSDNITIYKHDVGKKRKDYWRMKEIAKWTCKAYKKSKRLINQNDYDLCHCWFGWPPGLIGYWFRKKLPYLVALRGSDIPGYNPRLNLLDKLLFTPLSRIVWKNAEDVTVNSKDSAEMAKKTLERDYEIIYNGIDTDEFFPSKETEGNGLKLLFVGRLIERKGVNYLLEALERVIEEISTPEIRLTIVGDGKIKDKLQNKTRRLGLKGNVKFLGSLPHKSLPSIYRKHDIFVLPSIQEALSNVVLEAIASGLAIITTNTGAAEMIDGNGYVVERKNPDQIRKALTKYAENQDILNDHQNKSRKIAENLEWESFAEEYYDLYGKMIEG